MSKKHPLEGLLVVDFTHVLAGPACSYYLGLLGADIIKVESATKGDAIRHRGGTDNEAANAGMSTSYLTQGAGKKSIAIDLASLEGKAQFHQLLSRADVLVENHVPATMHRLGLDEHSLAAQHPRLIHCAMTGYGRGGPQENTPAYDVNIQASCGLMDATGTQESGPIRAGAPVLDYGTAMAASFAISAALFERANRNVVAILPTVALLAQVVFLVKTVLCRWVLTKNLILLILRMHLGAKIGPVTRVLNNATNVSNMRMNLALKLKLSY